MDFDKFGYWDENLDGKTDLEDILLIDDYDDEMNSLKESGYDSDDDYSIFDGEDSNEDLDEENDESVTEPNTTFTISIGLDVPPRTVPTTGYWKYFHGDIWDTDKALIEHFPELQDNYDVDSYNDVRDMLPEIFYYAPQKAIEYYRWLVDYFPYKDIDTPDGFVNYNYSMRVEALSKMFSESRKESSKVLLAEVTRDNRILDAFFKEVTWKKHETHPLLDCMEFFLSHNMLDKIFDVYDMYAQNQKGRFTNRDLTELWSSFISLYFSDMQASKRKAFGNRLMALLKAMLPVSLKAVDQLKESMKNYS